jgi:hypothetical protein
MSNTATIERPKFACPALVNGEPCKTSGTLPGLKNHLKRTHRMSDEERTAALSVYATSDTPAPAPAVEPAPETDTVEDTELPETEDEEFDADPEDLDEALEQAAADVDDEAESIGSHEPHCDSHDGGECNCDPADDKSGVDQLKELLDLED